MPDTHSNRSHSERLMVFAKAPRLGEVKTRLCPPLTTEQAFAFHRALVEDTLDRLQRVERPALEYHLYMSEPLHDPSLLTIPPEWRTRTQRGRDLGERLESAFRESFQEGVERIVVVGSDSPTLPLDCVNEAFEELSRYDVVIGPSLDGGYYLLGCSRFIPDIFHGISWGGVTVLRETTEAIRRSRKSFNYLIDWYDVDTDEDLMRLREEIAFYSRVDPERIPRRVQAVLPPDDSTDG